MKVNKFLFHTKQKRPVIIPVFLLRFRADSNRCGRFCRPLPSHSATKPQLFGDAKVMKNIITQGCLSRKIGNRVQTVRTKASLILIFNHFQGLIIQTNFITPAFTRHPATKRISTSGTKLCFIGFAGEILTIVHLYLSFSMVTFTLWIFPPRGGFSLETFTFDRMTCGYL